MSLLLTMTVFLKKSGGSGVRGDRGDGGESETGFTLDCRNAGTL